MTGIIDQEDPFYITFGKQNWDTLHVNKSTKNQQHETPKKRLKNILKSQTQRSAHRQQNTSTKKKSTLLHEPNKQGDISQRQTSQKIKRRYSLLSSERKHPSHFVTLRQQVMKQKLTHQAQKVPRKTMNLFDQQLSKRLKDIETVYQYKKDKLRASNDYKRIQSIHEPFTEKGNYIKAQIFKRPKLCSANQPTLDKYREQMKKLDSLIGKINARIKISDPKYC